MTPWIIRCRDDGHAAAEAARTALDARVLTPGEEFAFAISGGRAAPLFFDQLVEQSRRRGVSMAQADYFWADERCVPPEHPESNFAAARSRLLDPLGVDPSRIHRIQGELLPPEAAHRANADWERWLASSPRRNGCLDCAVLGVGEDGHVASLFPENLPADLASDAPFHAVTGSKPPPQRITMGYPMFWRAKLLVVLVTGAGKETVVSRSLHGTLDSPLARVQSRRGERDTIVISPLVLSR